MEGSDAFAGGETAPAEAPAEAEQTPAEATPDLSEQEQALAAKIGDQVTAAVRDSLGQQGQQEAPEPTADDWIDSLLGAEETEIDDEPGEPAQPQAEQQVAPEDPILQTPTGQALVQGYQQLAEQNEQLRDYLVGREEREERQALEKFAEANPDIRRPEVLRQVTSRVDAIAERAGDPTLKTDPTVVSTAYHAVRSEMAAAARADGGQTPAQPGVPPETNAGAAVDGSVSDKDQFWGEVRGAGGTAFPT